VRRRITRPFSPTRHHVDKGARSIRSEHTRNHSGERRPAGRYGLPAITQSFLHFLLGKGVSAGAAFIVLIIAIRKLTHAEFAVYTSMNAMVLLIGLVSSFGTNQVMMRFLPELKTRGNIAAMYRLLFRGITVRGFTFAAVALLLYVFAAPICRALEFDQWVEVVRWYCLVGFLRVTSTFIGAALESMLWQREAQYSAAIGGLLQLLLVGGAVWRGGMTLPEFVAIEIVSEGVLLLLILGWAIARWRADPERNVGDPDVLRRERDRYSRFAFWSYAQNLTSIGFGSAPNRLLVSYFLPIDALARFGVIDRFIAFVVRYLPLRMFVGLFRPVLNSRFDGGKGYDTVIASANMLFRGNLVVLMVPFVVFGVAGDALFAWLTGGKYVDLTALFLGFLAVAILTSVDNLMDIIVKLLEESRIYTATNIVRSCAIALAIPLVHSIGLWSLVVANFLGLLIAFTIIFMHLRRRGRRIRVDWSLVARIIAFAAGAIGLGQAIILVHVPPIPAAMAAGAAFVLALWLWPPLKPAERQQVGSLASSVKQRLVRRRA